MHLFLQAQQQARYDNFYECDHNSPIIFSSSPFLPFKLVYFVETAFFATSSCLPFSAISSVASLMCFSASFTSSVCISISLLIASNLRLFFTLSLCFSYFFIKSCDSFIAAFFCSINCCIPLSLLQYDFGVHASLQFHLPGH